MSETPAAKEELSWEMLYLSDFTRLERKAIDARLLVTP